MCRSPYIEQVTTCAHTHTHTHTHILNTHMLSSKLLPNTEHPERDLIWIKDRTCPMCASPVCVSMNSICPIYISTFASKWMRYVSIHAATMVLCGDLDRRKDVIDSRCFSVLSLSLHACLRMCLNSHIVLSFRTVHLVYTLCGRLNAWQI